MKYAPKAVAAGFAVSLGLMLGLATGHSADDKRSHRLAVQVSANDPASMNLALNNVVNVAQEYSQLGEEVEIEVVAYGPGLHMRRNNRLNRRPASSMAAVVR
jgi:hypothetical protein